MTFSSALLLASILGAMFVGLQCARLPHSQCPWPVDLYIWAQVVFALCGWICEAYVSRTDRWYSLIYCFGMIPATTMAMWLSLYALRGAKMYPLVATEIILLLGLSYQVREKYAGWPWANKLIFFVSVCFTVSGFFLLLSLDKLAGNSWDSIRLSFGTFLLAMGLLHWMLPARLYLNYKETASMTHWVPAFMAIGAFCWLGWTLSHAKIAP